MSAQSAQEINEACDNFGRQLQKHHDTANTMWNELSNDLNTWVGTCEKFIGHETSKIYDTVVHTHQPPLLQLLQFLESHPKIVQAVGQDAIRLFEEVR